MDIGTSDMFKRSLIKNISSEKNKNIRGGLARYIINKYGLLKNSVYAKLRDGSFKPWEVIGIDECCKRFNGCVPEKPDEYFMNLRKKSLFLKHMVVYGMSAVTVRKKFMANDLSAFERKGLQNIVREYLEEINGVLEGCDNGAE